MSITDCCLKILSPCQMKHNCINENLVTICFYINQKYFSVYYCLFFRITAYSQNVATFAVQTHIISLNSYLVFFSPWGLKAKIQIFQMITTEQK